MRQAAPIADIKNLRRRVEPAGLQHGLPLLAPLMLRSSKSLRARTIQPPVCFVKFLTT